MILAKKRHGRLGRGGYGEGGGGEGGPSRLPTDKEVANTGTNKSRPLGVVIVLPKTKKWRG